MYVEPAVYQHVEVILGVARRGPGQGVAATDLAEELALSTATVANLLRNLAAAGLLWSRSAPGGPFFGLARTPRAITLAEVSAVAAPASPAHGARLQQARAPGARAGVTALSASIEAYSQRLMAGLTVADLLDDHAIVRPGAGSPTRADQSDRPGGAVEPATLWAWAKKGRAHAVVDVRAEPGDGMAAPPWARWMPLERLPLLQQRLPRDRPIVTVCATGARSEIAAQYLRSIGFERASALAGGLAAWQGTPPAE